MPATKMSIQTFQIGFGPLSVLEGIKYGDVIDENLEEDKTVT